VVSWTMIRDEQWWNWTDCRITICELNRWQAQWWAEQWLGTSSGETEQIAELQSVSWADGRQGWAEQGAGTSSGETEQIADLQSVSWTDGRHSGELNREKGRAAEQRTGTVRRQYIGGRICRWKPSILGSSIIEHPAIGRRRCYHPVNFPQTD